MKTVFLNKKMMWVQLNNLSDHFIKKVALPNIAVAKTSWWQKRHLALKSWWHKRRFLVLGGTNVIFLGIGGRKVDLVEGGKNVVVAVAKTSQRKNVGGKKVAASNLPTLQILFSLILIGLYFIHHQIYWFITKFQ
jgi:hypothetical protein